ncbi:hypothetical protein TrLO_g11733 [Triparma laevis f. longispina]|uniref:Uncharacterized protein n=1 Tax=Triparma laevis f. longispina TaxID=1714387 RepID=A0A9W7C104_9STRA|nr:hypothetical protein TrLO_g11733 [Triparma laevis f. longispina]
MQWEWDSTVDKSTVVRLCLNCNPACVNFNSSVNPHRHATGGMCGACNQKWNRLPPSGRWKVRHCTSRCRCIKCFPITLPTTTILADLYKKVRRKTAVGCVNCEETCPNKNLPAVAKKHATSGMCGSCTQRWNRHANARWPVTICTSKCRCDRCRSTPMLEEHKIADLHTSVFDPRMLAQAATRVGEGGGGGVQLSPQRKQPPAWPTQQQSAATHQIAHQQYMQALAQQAKIRATHLPTPAPTAPGMMNPMGYPLYPNPYATAATMATAQKQQQQVAIFAQQQQHQAALALVGSATLPNPIPAPAPAPAPLPLPPAHHHGTRTSSAASSISTSASTTSLYPLTNVLPPAPTGPASVLTTATLYANQIMEQLVQHQNTQRSQLIASQKQEKDTILAHLASNQSFPSAKYFAMECEPFPGVGAGVTPAAVPVAPVAPVTVTADADAELLLPTDKVDEPPPTSVWVKTQWPLVPELAEDSKTGKLYGPEEATLIVGASKIPVEGMEWMFEEEKKHKTRPRKKKAKLNPDPPATAPGTVSIPRCFQNNVYNVGDLQPAAIQLFKTVLDLCSNPSHDYSSVFKCDIFEGGGFKICSSSDSSMKLSRITMRGIGLDGWTAELLARFILSADFQRPEFDEVTRECFEKQPNSRIVHETFKAHCPYLVVEREEVRFEAWSRVGKDSYFIAGQSVGYGGLGPSDGQAVKVDCDVIGYWIRQNGNGVELDVVHRCDLKGTVSSALVQTMYAISCADWRNLFIQENEGVKAFKTKLGDCSCCDFFANKLESGMDEQVDQLLGGGVTVRVS